ncbi:MAG TPA: RdgB/HAM1 family non-canonical purine NTP pyrophosphatase [Phycisphaerae bacterium]|nr:RdgB/HAM1 family non-canonical purine NTP pyrophosphatase [Phycisphaerae bacterium]
MRCLVLATSNAGKVREIRRALQELPLRILGLAELGQIDEPAETGGTFADNARLKASYYARAAGTWALAEDSGLEVDALGGAPGVYSARYAAGDCAPDAPRQTIDQANNAKVLRALAGVPDERRTGRFVCCMVLADPQRILLEAGGSVEGQITRAPRGDNGFGYDPLFYVPELGCTTAELSTEQKNRISHRGKAVRRFAKRLADLLSP